VENKQELRFQQYSPGHIIPKKKPAARKNMSAHYYTIFCSVVNKKEKRALKYS
jgi:hypothetical protein